MCMGMLGFGLRLTPTYAECPSCSTTPHPAESTRDTARRPDARETSETTTSPATHAHAEEPRTPRHSLEKSAAVVTNGSASPDNHPPTASPNPPVESSASRHTASNAMHTPRASARPEDQPARAVVDCANARSVEPPQAQ